MDVEFSVNVDAPAERLRDILADVKAWPRRAASSSGRRLGL